MQSALLGWRLGCQGVELFSWSVARFPFFRHHLPFPEHVHRSMPAMVCWAVSINLNPRIGWTHSFHDAMILLCHIIELEKIDGLSRVVHRMLQVAPLAFDLDL
jgi:hypothetical protein